ncbi:hypothetical protein C0Q70_06780 [Pomacea canaliculata]|uniref:NtA domain-containing protein n=1 Tax=Pomacea canaliculata TaxID=400727 RepID=A0A2T7PD81_POMCA|nr:hypothetical protein C0Q70_06780 [Pomacea canaliculata]
MAVVYLLILFLAKPLVAQRISGDVVKWSRTVLDLNGEPLKVEESVVVTENDKEVTVLMNSSDPALARTPFIGTVTLHDFKLGLLAMKPQGVELCFFGKVARSYDEVLAEIKVRAETGYNPYVAEPRWMSRPARSESRTTGSNVLDKFCEGRKLMPVVDVDNWAHQARDLENRGSYHSLSSSRLGSTDQPPQIAIDL